MVLLVLFAAKDRNVGRGPLIVYFNQTIQYGGNKILNVQIYLRLIITVLPLLVNGELTDYFQNSTTTFFKILFFS